MNPATALTVPGLKIWARENKALAMTVCKAMAFAQLERERVDAYIEPIFLRYGFTNDIDRPRNTHKGEILTHSKQLYLSEDEERCKAYYAECAAAHREHGWTGDPEHCPALVAENLQIQAENLLLESLGEFTGTGKGETNGGFYTLELRKKALDLALGVCLAKGGLK